MDISKLTEEQKALAFKVGERAVQKGLNPDFILPMVMQESSFDHSKVSPQGARGVMQITDDTARLYKCENPKDVDQNIDCGLNIIQDLVSKKNIGNDPYKVLAGYHSGEPQAKKFLETGDINDLGPNARQHLYDVSNIYGNELPKVVVGEAQKEEVPEVKPPTLPPAGTPNADANAVPEINPLFGMLPGAGYGAAVGTGLAVADAKFNAASGAKQALDSLLNRNPAAAIETPVTATVETPKVPTITSPQTAVTPKHGGQNWVKSLTDVDLPAAQMSKADLDLAKGMQSAVGRSGEAGFTGGKITPGGVIISPQTASAIDAKKTGTQKLLEDARLMREAQAKIAQQAAQQSSAAEAAMLARGEGQVASTAATEAAERTSPLWHYIRRLASFPVKGAVAGAGAGFSALDALNRYNQKDYQGATISGLGGLAGTVAPFVGSMGALPSLSIAAPLYLSASDRIEYLKKHPEAIRLQEDDFDAMGNRIR